MYRIYQRVSTTRQSTDAQVPDLQAFAERTMQAGKSVKIYAPDKWTGTTLTRPVFSVLLDDLRPGDTLVVWRLDRLGRTANGLIGLLAQLEERKIWFMSLRDGIDTTNGGNATSRLLQNVLASVAQFETEVRGERVAAGIAAKKARGETQVHHGWRKGKARKLQPTMVATILQLHLQGMKITEISRTLRVSRPTIYTVLNSVTKQEPAAAAVS